MALQKEFELQGNWLFRWRSFLPLTILLLGMTEFIQTIHKSGILFSTIVSHWHLYEAICLFVGLLGAAVRIYTVGHTPVGTSGRNTTLQVADSLNTTGVYSVVRHPLYLGNFLMWLSLALLTCSDGFVVSFILAYWLYYERIMYAEEQYLIGKFGDSYLRWAGRTPAFIPDFRKFVPSRLPFSWKKVVKKEKNGVFALFFLFSLFDGVAAWQSNLIFVNRYLLGCTIISGVAYVILKYVKKHTHLLDEKGR